MYDSSIKKYKKEFVYYAAYLNYNNHKIIEKYFIRVVNPYKSI